MSKSIRFLVPVVAVVLLSACAAGADQSQTESTPPGMASANVHMVSVPAGTELTLALDTSLSSGTSVAGDAFSATVVESIVVQDREVIPAGSTIEGRVTEATAAKAGAGKATLGLSFGALRLASGYHTNVVGSFQEVTESKKGRNAAIIGGSAAGGALLGRILGKDTRGAVIGTIIGGGVGTAVVMSKEGAQAIVPADTPFGLRLEQAIQVPHVASRT